MAAAAQGEEEPQPKRGLLVRLFTRRVGAMLARNTLVSSCVFLLGLSVLWVLVERLGVNAVVAAGASFLVANTLHYVLGRTWIFRGSTRGVGSGYLLFMLNSAVGLTITVALFAALLHFTPIYYVWARVVVSVFAGLAMFVLNAVHNFRRV